MTAPLFFVERAALLAERVVVDGAEGRHAADVRRIRVGERVDVGDGHGLVVEGVAVEVTRGRVVVAPEARREVAVPDPRFVVVQAVAKGGRDEDAVEAMTEVGVDEVVGWQARRSVARWTDRTADKWRATAREAAKQAHRPRVPDVVGPASTQDVARRLRSAALPIVLHERASAPLAAVAVPAAGDVVVVVGPEGGVDEGEVAVFTDAGAHVCRLGDTVLRTSTAGVGGGRGGGGAPPPPPPPATRWR